MADEKKNEEQKDCSTSLWVDGKVENTPLPGLVYPIYFSQFVIASRGVAPVASVFRNTTLDVAVAASSAMRYSAPMRVGKRNDEIGFCRYNSLAETVIYLRLDDNVDDLGLEAAINAAVAEQKAQAVPPVEDSQEAADAADHSSEAKTVCSMVRKFVQTHMLR